MVAGPALSGAIILSPSVAGQNIIQKVTPNSAVTPLIVKGNDGTDTSFHADDFQIQYPDGTPLVGFRKGLRYDLKEYMLHWYAGGPSSQQLDLSNAGLQLRDSGGNPSSSYLAPGAFFGPGGAGNAYLLKTTMASRYNNLIVLDDSGLGGAQSFAVAGNATTTITGADAATNSVTNLLTLGHATSGQPVAGFGVGLPIRGHSSTNTMRTMARLRAQWTAPTDASYAAQGVLSAWYMNAGTPAERDVIVWGADASAAYFAVFGVTPAAQQAGGVMTAGGAYGANEQSMLQKAYNVLRTFGFLN